jgi:hypothetical protein
MNLVLEYSTAYAAPEDRNVWRDAFEIVIQSVLQSANVCEIRDHIVAAAKIRPSRLCEKSTLGPALVSNACAGQRLSCSGKERPTPH